MSANDKQIGGTHYKGNVIQPWDYITANNMGFLDGNVVKYITRYARKGGVEDLKKVQHYVEKLIELNSPHEQPPTILKDGGIQEALPLVWGEGDPRTVRGRGDDPRSVSSGTASTATGGTDWDQEMCFYKKSLLKADKNPTQTKDTNILILDEATDFLKEQDNNTMSFYERTLLRNDE